MKRISKGERLGKGVNGEVTRPLEIMWIMRCSIPDKREELHLVGGGAGGGGG